METRDPVADIMGRCIHYTGVLGPGAKRNECCAAGVRYDDVRIDHDPPIPYRGRSGREYKAANSLPCTSVLNQFNLATCEKRETPTREQAETQNRASMQYATSVLGAIMTVHKVAANHNGADAGLIVCPRCGGHLHWGIARSNGHTLGRCETDACLAWIE